MRVTKVTEREIINCSRRKFLAGGVAVGAGLTLGVSISGRAAVGANPAVAEVGDSLVATSSFEPNIFIRIGTDNLVTVLSKHVEMGQGVYTGLATLVAEELDASWAQMRVLGAPANAELYSDSIWGEQATGGSTAMASSFVPMRQAGAAAREMLVVAAAQKWSVTGKDITVHEGMVSHSASGRLASFGELAQLAARQPVPDKVVLKNPNEYRLIGTHLARIDSANKINGTVRYTQDIQLPGMLTAVVAHAPLFGATLKSFDGTDAKAIDGVVEVVGIPTGVAVLASDFWTAKKGRDQLIIEWDETAAFLRSSDEITAGYRQLAKARGAVARRDGDSDQAIGLAAQVVEAEYEFPYLSHAPMEPLSCVVRLTADTCEIWNASQLQTRDQKGVAAALGMSPEQIKINLQYAGGAFGRRGTLDYTIEAVTIAQAIRGRAPVKLVWTREDDMQAGKYRPLNYHRLRGGLDSDGNLTAWQHRLVGQSIATQESFDYIINGVDISSVEGANNLPYQIPNTTVDLHSPKIGVPVLWHRGVAGSHTTFAVETFIDELATAADRDAVEFRRYLLRDHPRMLGVLDLATKRAGWAVLMKPGTGRGIAVREYAGTCLAQIAEVTLRDNIEYSVDRVIIAVDCGMAINPNVICAQMESGTSFGLSTVFAEELVLNKGRVEQTNLDSYQLLRIDKMPDIDVHIVNSLEPPSGVGEIAVMPIAAAVANALYSVTGHRYHKLPISQAQ